MSAWNTNPTWANPQDFNLGQQFTSRDGVTYVDFNAIIHNLLWLKRNSSAATPVAELVTIEVPAAGSVNTGDWIKGGIGDSYYMENTFTDASASSAVLQSCTNVKAFTENGLRLEYKNDWEIWIDSLPESSCVLSLLFIPHNVEDEPCIFPPLGVGGNNGDPGTYYTVKIPTAGSENMYGWYAVGDIYELQIMDVAWMTADLFLELKSENAALFTEHGLTLHQDDGFLDFSIDSLPERESTLYIVVPNYTDSGLLNGGDA